MNKKEGWLVGTPLFAMAIFFIDRLTKVYFSTHPEISFELIPDWLWLRFHLNTGMALSIPLIPALYYTLTSVVLLALVARCAYVITHKIIHEYVIILFILSGAISNLLDRFNMGGVIDFVQFRWGSIFNLSDVTIVGAVATWIGFILYDEHHKKISTPR